jgi:hypothetical protein
MARLRQRPPGASIVLVVLAAGLAGAFSGATPAALPLFASASTGATATAAAAVTVATPPSAGPGHVLVASVAVRDQTVISAPPGWTEAISTTCDGSLVLTQAIFVRVADAGEPPAHTFITPAATGAVGTIAAYTSVDVLQPVEASGGQVRRNSRLITAPSVTTNVEKAMLVGFFAHSGRSAITPPAGMSARADVTTGSTAPSARMIAVDEPRPAAGPTGSRTTGEGQWNSCGVGQTIALRPAPDPPVSTSPPVVVGTAQEGRLLTATAGSWTGPATSFAFRWERSTPGGTWEEITGATAADHLLGAAEIGSTVRVVVTAANAGGFGNAASAPTATVLPAPPLNTVAPAVAGVTRERQMLTADPGTWTGSPTFSFQWQRSDGAGGWQDLADATDAAYVPSASDVGSTLRVVVTAVNAGGSGSATSAATAPIDPAAPPSSLEPPAIAGDQREGSTLTATTGTWAGSPTSYAHEWQRSADGGQTWTPAALGDTHLLLVGDVGSIVRVVVTASNSVGAATAASDATAPILPAPPTNVDAPAILGLPQEQAPLTATPGTWTGDPTSYAYQWRRSSDGGGTWVDIAGAVGAGYTPTADDVGRRLSVTVSAENAGGSGTAASAASEPVLPLPPEAVSAPVVTGAAIEGGTLLASTGEWLHDPVAFAFEWRRCDETGCTEAPWETDPEYAVARDDVDFTLHVVVTALNLGGSASAASTPTAPVLPAPPLNEDPPIVSGVPAEGETLTASTGEWRSVKAIVYAYRWERSNDEGQVWSDVPGADQASYFVLAEDVGYRLRVVVTAANTGGATSAPSGPTGEVAGADAPLNVVAPTISGVIQDRGRLNANAGVWSGTPAFAYVWQRSVDGGVTWTDIPRATSFRYTAAAADVGQLLRVSVTAANELGAATAASEPTEIFAAGNRFILINSTWYCDGPVDVELVKVTTTDGQNRDAMRIDNCSGRIARVEVDTNAVDGLKVRNTDPVAHDLTIEGGYVRCHGHPPEAHQDGIQVMGGARLTFRNLVIWCGNPLDFGAGVNSAAMIALGGGGASTPTDVIIEHSVMGPGSANGVLIATSIRSGIRNSVACPDWTPAGGAVLIESSAVDGVDLDNEKPGLEDPRCSSFEAALAWAQP